MRVIHAAYRGNVALLARNLETGDEAVIITEPKSARYFSYPKRPTMQPPKFLTPRYGRSMLIELAVLFDTDGYWELAAAGTDVTWHDPARAAAELKDKIDRAERPTIGWVRRNTVDPDLR